MCSGTYRRRTDDMTRARGKTSLGRFLLYELGGSNMKMNWHGAKRILCAIAMFVLCAFALTGCGTQATKQQGAPDKVKIGVANPRIVKL